MNTRFLRLLVVLLALGLVAPNNLALAQKKTVHVKEYTKRDGTTVEAHDRKAPEKRGTTTTAAKPKPVNTSKPPSIPKPKRQSTIGTASGIARDESGRIERSDAARNTFLKGSGYPNGRPGYVVDHIIPLACGGADAPSNMQWQTVEQAKAKDRVERAGC